MRSSFSCASGLPLLMTFATCSSSGLSRNTPSSSACSHESHTFQSGTVESEMLMPSSPTVGMPGSLINGGVFFVVQVKRSRSPLFSCVCSASPTLYSCSFAVSGAHSTSVDSSRWSPTPWKLHVSL